MRLAERVVYWHLIVGAIVGTLVIIGIAVAIFYARNPRVEYHGVIMHKSEMLTERTDGVFCQQMASFSLGVMYTCFDSEAELDAFAESR